MVFIDTAGWIALINKRDELHSRAMAMYSKIGKKKTPD